MLANKCADAGLSQIIKEPTRGLYLLDVCIIDMADTLKVWLLPKISDHRGLLIEVRTGIPVTEKVPRTIWHYKSANWAAMNRIFATSNWDWIDHISSTEGAGRLTRFILEVAAAYIPNEEVYERKSSHPWINDRCRRAVAKKHASAGQQNFQTVAVECSRILLEEHQLYIKRLRTKLLRTKTSSKMFWKIGNRLLNKMHIGTCAQTLRRYIGQRFERKMRSPRRRS